MNNWMDAYEKHMYDHMPYRLLRPIADPSRQGVSPHLQPARRRRQRHGTDNIKNLRHWNATLAAETHRRKYPSFVLAPQTPLRWLMPDALPEITPEYLASLSDIWQARIQRLLHRGDDLTTGDLGTAFDLLDAICEAYPIDRNRIYVLGHSMGGFGTWNAICERPDRFAAAIPSAGGCEPWNDISRITRIPIWTFHGDVDQTVPVDLTRDAFRQLHARNANAKYTELKNIGHAASAYGFAYTGDDPQRGFTTHFASDQCDKTENVWDWLFAQKRGQ